MMGATVFLTDVAGHAVQMMPPMILYFLCVPEEMYRCPVKKAWRWYFPLAMLFIIAGSALKLFIISRYPQILPNYISVSFLFAEFVVLAVSTHAFVRVPASPGHIIILLVLFWGTMQYTVSRFILLVLDKGDIYDGVTLLVFSVLTLILFPVAQRLFVPYAREYLQIREAVRSPAQTLVFIMAAVSIVQLFLASWEEHEPDFFALALMSVCITGTHWILIRYVVMEEQRARTEMHLLASQIRPHFLLNTLNAIINLVDEDTDATKQAMYNFSGYLRMNFEALRRDTPVGFAEELRHVRFYLSIEKLRFREELKVEIDTPVTEFALPALTVQPVVENAVRHGLRGKEGTGNIYLATRETEDAYEITIRDDGAGMEVSGDGNPVTRGDGTHHGLKNVRARLRQMVGGTLELESAPGKGTTATIRIPKNRGQ